jgi:hypothetical protein
MRPQARFVAAEDYELFARLSIMATTTLHFGPIVSIQYEQDGR